MLSCIREALLEFGLSKTKTRPFLPNLFTLSSPSTTDFTFPFVLPSKQTSHHLVGDATVTHVANWDDFMDVLGCQLCYGAGRCQPC